MATIKANAIKANTIKAETITSATPKKQSQPVTPQETSSAPKPSSSKPRAAQSRSLVSQSPKQLPQPKPFLSDLAHSPGAITSQKRIEAQQNFKPVEDIITAQIVGNDFSTGETKVKDGSGNIYSVTIGQQAFQPSFAGGQGRSASIVVGQSVIISRSRSQSGERTVRLVSVIPLGQSPKDALAALPGNPNVNDLCVPSQNTSTAQSPKSEPETPEEPQIPAPPTEPSPNDPPKEDDPPSKPFGCSPEDPAQWYNGSICPAGLESLGFAELPDGSIKSLCSGPGRPPGDGCPESPDEYGWICVSGSCEYVPFGLYTTKAECENVCLDEPLEESEEVPLSGFVCISGSCVPSSENPQFDTLASCEEARSPIYGDPPFTGGQCVPSINYGVIITRASGGTFNNTLFARGPITGLTVTQIGTFQYRITLSGLNASGQPFTSFTDQGVLSGEGAPTATLYRVDEQADNCGDPIGPITGYTC